MKQVACTVMKGAGLPDSAQMSEINKYTRRELSAEEVYVFSVLLCDNEIDRDNERFSIGTLKKLAELFKGKTGIFDHSMEGKNQTARIFLAGVEQDANRRTLAGEPYTMLKAYAYMPRTQKNEDLIQEIDAGIKKEVSVGCAVERVICSVCAQDMRGVLAATERARNMREKSAMRFWKSRVTLTNGALSQCRRKETQALQRLFTSKRRNRLRLRIFLLSLKAERV